MSPLRLCWRQKRWQKDVNALQIEETEAQMAEMHQSSALLAEAEASLRQQVSSLQVNLKKCILSS